MQRIGAFGCGHRSARRIGVCTILGREETRGNRKLSVSAFDLSAGRMEGGHQLLHGAGYRADLSTQEFAHQGWTGRTGSVTTSFTLMTSITGLERRIVEGEERGGGK